VRESIIAVCCSLGLIACAAEVATNVTTRVPEATQATDAATEPAASAESSPADAEMQFEAFELVLLWRGERSESFTEAEAETIQAGHLAHLEAMVKSGALVIAGPFSDQPDQGLRGMCLYRTGSHAEARALAEADPAVKAGRLRVEVMTWWVEKDTMRFPKATPYTKP